MNLAKCPTCRAVLKYETDLPTCRGSAATGLPPHDPSEAIPLVRPDKPDALFEMTTPHPAHPGHIDLDQRR